MTTLHGSRRKHKLYCWEVLFTTPLRNNGSYSIVACIFVAAGMCLLSRCLAMNIYSDFTIPGLKHNRSGMVAVLGPVEALPCYIHTIPAISRTGY
jgi:hypothetical protein